MIQRFAHGLLQAEVTGAGDSVWVLHSLLADAGSCRPLAAALAGAHRVVLPDLPGFGGSAPVDGIEEVAGRIAEALCDDGAEDRPAALIGNGYGSFVALLVALRHPGLVTRLVLAGAGASFPEAGRQAFRGMAMAAGAKGLEAIAEVAMRRLFSPAFQADNPGLIAERRARFLATEPAVFARACADLASLDVQAEVGGLAVPTLIVVGDGDEATPPAMGRALAGLIPGARYTELAGLAHVPQLQDTARFVAALTGFL